MRSSLPGWQRIAWVVPLFACALGGVVWSWQMSPRSLSDADQLPNGINGPGDLSAICWSIGIAFVIAFAALQPWTAAPRRRWMAFAGVCFGGWAVLQFGVALHAPPVALPRDLLLLALSAWLSCAVFVSPTRTHLEQN